MKMKKQFSKISLIFVIILTIFALTSVYAEDDIASRLSYTKYSEEYEKWLDLSEEERANTLEPRKYDIITKTDNQTYLKSINNVFRMQQLMRASATDGSYDLRDVIPENVQVRNQGRTDICWAFATTGVLESHLGLTNTTSTVYDFSEKHMDYATARSAFLNNEINEYGFTREINSGGNFYLAIQYIANGLGAIAEEDMPFNESNADIDISEVENQEVITTLYDTAMFPSLDTNATESEKTGLMTQMKQHIINYGGIYAGIHGANILGTDSYNNETGAIYCDNPTEDLMDHAVTIIGWDDSYSKDNFNANQQPEEDGAWIIKNSWGATVTDSLSEAKQEVFDRNPTYWTEQGYATANDIPNNLILPNYEMSYGTDKVTVEGDNIIIELGDEGYMYVSYEDCNIYSYLSGIEKATDSKDYKNVYQNDELGASDSINYNATGSLYLANVFTRNTQEQEALNQISIWTTEEYSNCKVWINPNGNSKAVADLQEVELAEGDTITCSPGLNTIVFADPITLTGDSFIVVLEVEEANRQVAVAIEKDVGGMWDNVVVNAGESFCTDGELFENNTWADLATTSISGSNTPLAGNLCIKAYTVEPTPEDPTDPTDPTQEPVLSNFDNTTSAITETKMYFDSADSENGYVEMTIKIEGIELGDENTNYTHYYHLSGTQGDDNITDWRETQIQKENDGTYSITLSVNSDDLANIDQVSQSDNLYVYIREVAQANGEEVEQIVTLETENQSEPEIYVNNQLVGNMEDFLNSNTGNNNGDEQDDTVAQSILPYAGSVAFKAGIVILIVAIGGFAFFRYKNIDK